MSPRNFKIEDRDELTIIYYKDSDYYFKFIKALGSIYIVSKYIELCPAKYFYIQRIDLANFVSWNNIMTYLEEWIFSLKREIETPDKWLEMLEMSKRINWSTEDELNTQFTFEEYNDIKNRIDLVKTKLAEIDITPEQLNLLNSKLDYIAEKAKTIGRIDWKNIIIGTILAYFAQMAIPPNTAKTIWLIVQDIFKGILQLTVH